MELCVVVTNVNAMRAEYWHRKTTPDMSIREAVYMSLSLPGKRFTNKFVFCLRFVRISNFLFDVSIEIDFV